MRKRSEAHLENMDITPAQPQSKRLKTNEKYFQGIFARERILYTFDIRSQVLRLFCMF